MMNIRFVIQLRRRLVLLVPAALVMTLASCQSQKRASASVGATGSTGLAAYPDGVPPLAAPVGSVPEPSAGEKVASSQQFKPFSLRDGEELISYKAVPGDTLGKIASRYNTSVVRIKSANGLTTDNIFAGKTYKIPTLKGASPADESGGHVSAPSSPPKPEPASSRYGLPAEENADRLSPPAYNPPNLSTTNTYIPPVSSTQTREYGPPPVTVPTSGGASAFPQPTFGSGSF